MHKAEGCAWNWWSTGFRESQVLYRTIMICRIAPPTTYPSSCTKPADSSIPHSQYTLSRTCGQAEPVVYEITTITYLFILNFHVQFIYMYSSWFLHLQSNRASIAWPVKVESESWLGMWRGSDHGNHCDRIWGQRSQTHLSSGTQYVPGWYEKVGLG